MPQSDTDIRDYIQRTLGGGVVNVELTSDHYDDAIFDAKMWFAGHIGQTKNKVLDVTSNGGSFDVASDCFSVVECFFDVQSADLFDQFDWAGVELNPLGFGIYGSYYADGYGMGGGYSYLVQAMQYRDQARKVLSSDRDWEWDHAARQLRIYPVDGDVGGKVFVVYMTDTVEVEKMRPYEYRMVRRWALAQAMESLGYIRSKYADGPSATGTISLNGTDLIANADQIRSELGEQILSMKPPAHFFAD